MSDITQPPAPAGRKLFKRLLPRSLMGRSLLILLLPLVLAQLVATYMFFDRHLDNLTNRLAYGVSGDIALAAAIIERWDRPDRRNEMLSAVERHTDLRIQLKATEGLTNSAISLDTVGQVLHRNLALRFNPETFLVLPATANLRQVQISLPEGLMVVDIPERRLVNFSGYIFLFWMVGSAAFFFAIAVLFMRNQVRPIRRLADAAERFGKGDLVRGFKPEGAAEVRRAAQAFLQMRERIRRQIRQRTEMLAGVSHDLRTPLTRMKLQLALMGDAKGIDELDYDIAEMERMIEGYLAFARGEGDEETSEVDIADLLAAVAQDTARISHRPISFERPDSLMLSVRPQAIRRCITNLVNNALTYGSEVKLSAEFKDNQIFVHIDDNGPGIPTEKRRHVLLPFVRLDESRNLETGGVGLGLTIARDAARAHGGDIILSDSQLGGLRATLRLPR